MGGTAPTVAHDAWIAHSADVVGDVRVGSRASIWYAAVVRGDGDTITIGEASNLQDGCVVHADPGLPVTLGRGVTVGHRAVLHGCTAEDDVLIGMGAVVLNGARIRSGSLVAAGAVVSEGMEVPENTLVAGVPARARRNTTAEEREMILANAESYVALVDLHADGR